LPDLTISAAHLLGRGAVEDLQIRLADDVFFVLAEHGAGCRIDVDVLAGTVLDIDGQRCQLHELLQVNLGLLGLMQLPEQARPEVIDQPYVPRACPLDLVAHLDLARQLYDQ
jgi:hypothetical protein